MQTDVDPTTGRGVVTRDYILSRDLNLVTNHWAQMANNYNFPSWTYTTSDSKVFEGCFSRTNYLGTMTSEFVPVDVERRYRISGWFKSAGVGGQSGLYAGIACFDRSGNYIQLSNYFHVATTETTLSAALHDGDTVIHLTSSANWSGAPTRYIGVFDDSYYNNAINGYYFYTRKIAIINGIGTGTATLSAAWDQGTVAAGTKVANTLSGSTYLYTLCGYAGIVYVPTTWTYYEGFIGGVIGSTEAQVVTKFRPGTNQVRLAVLPNFSPTNTDNHTLLMDGLSFEGNTAPLTMSDADAPKNFTYFSSTSSKLAYKDSAGTSHALY